MLLATGDANGLSGRLITWLLPTSKNKKNPVLGKEKRKSWVTKPSYIKGCNCKCGSTQVKIVFNV